MLHRPLCHRLVACLVLVLLHARTHPFKRFRLMRSPSSKEEEKKPPPKPSALPVLREPHAAIRRLLSSSANSNSTAPQDLCASSMCGAFHPMGYYFANTSLFLPSLTRIRTKVFGNMQRDSTNTRETPMLFAPRVRGFSLPAACAVHHVCSLRCRRTEPQKQN